MNMIILSILTGTGIFTGIITNFLPKKFNKILGNLKLNAINLSMFTLYNIIAEEFGFPMFSRYITVPIWGYFFGSVITTTIHELFTKGKKK